MSRRLNITVGEKFGRFTVVSEVKVKGRRILCCLCDCGEYRNVEPSHLSSGRSKSCGCFKSDRLKIKSTKHGMSDSSTYKSWEMMVQRCTNPKYDGYNNYGGRGISISDTWLNNFSSFLKDMGERPEGTTLDRIDVNGNYTKENCRWVENSIQAVNKRVKKHSTDYTGVCMCKGRFRAYITVKGVRYELGVFDSLDDAILARKTAELYYYPEVFILPVDNKSPS